MPAKEEFSGYVSEKSLIKINQYFGGISVTNSPRYRFVLGRSSSLPGRRSLIADSKHLEEPGGAHAAADAHGYNEPTHAAPFALDQRMADHARARHPVGVTDRD